MKMHTSMSRVRLELTEETNIRYIEEKTEKMVIDSTESSHYLSGRDTAGMRMSLKAQEAIAIRLEAIASRLEASLNILLDLERS